MPAKVKVKIIAGRDLPVMDRASDLTDAFVEVRFGRQSHRTDVYRKSLNPQWNSEWFRFEVDDEELQDEDLQIKVYDYDTYSAHDAIGKVYIDLNPLLGHDGPSVISGWFPIYDTMHGVRGEINVIVKLELFGDVNRYKQSSGGVQFFNGSGTPAGYKIQAIYGFVEELVVNDDPEHQWIDKIRTSRTSNEARQRLFSKLSGELIRKIGIKVLDMGGNSVLGYQHYFDLEGESGIVVRGIGTAVALVKFYHASPHSSSPFRDVSSHFLPHHSASQTRSRTHSLHTSRCSPFNRSQSVGDNPTSSSQLPYLSGRTHSPSAGSCASTAPSGSSASPGGKPALLSRSVTESMCSPHKSVRMLRSVSLQGSSIPEGFSDTSSSAPPHSQSGNHGYAAGLPTPDFNFAFSNSNPVPEEPSSPTMPSTGVSKGSSAIKVIPNQNRRNSDSELSTTPRGSSLAGSSGSGSGSAGRPLSYLRTSVPPQPVELQECPFFTMQSFPPYMLVHLGGIVSARSVKLLNRIHNPEEPETRDAWWTELRMEIRSHARSVGCHAVIGYVEQTSICEEVIILSAYGTAAVLNLTPDYSGDKDNVQTSQNNPPPLTMSMDRSAFDKEKHKLFIDVNLANQAAANNHMQYYNSGQEPHVHSMRGCEPCHIPYSDASTPFPVHLTKCNICRKHKVPDVLFTTVHLPEGLQSVGTGALVQARICRSKRDLKNDEANAKEISDSLPFMEYELHQQLLNKLKIKGMNALFGLHIQVVVGETMLVAVATATAVYIPALPVPAAPKIGGKINDNNMQRIQILQKQISDLMLHNKSVYDLSWDGIYEDSPRSFHSDDSEEDRWELDLSADKDTFVLEIDDSEDEAGVSLLMEENLPDGFYACTTEDMPGVPNLVTDIQMFTSVWQGEIGSKTSKEISKVFSNILKGLFFRLRSMKPCCLCRLSFNVELPEKERARISSCAMVAGLGEPTRLSRLQGSDQTQEELMFPMEEDTDLLPSQVPKPTKSKKRSHKYYGPTQHRSGVNLTPLSSIPGGKIDAYLGNLNFFYIRESTSLKENGGLSGFVQSFIIEVQSIVRAHVASLGGNAMVSYRMTECVLIDNIYKNQGQCLINVSGNAAQVSYDSSSFSTPPNASTPHKHSGSPRTADAIKVNLFPLKKTSTDGL